MKLDTDGIPAWRAQRMPAELRRSETDKSLKFPPKGCARNPNDSGPGLVQTAVVLFRLGRGPLRDRTGQADLFRPVAWRRRPPVRRVTGDAGTSPPGLGGDRQAALGLHG